MPSGPWDNYAPPAAQPAGPWDNYAPPDAATTAPVDNKPTGGDPYAQGAGAVRALGSAVVEGARGAISSAAGAAQAARPIVASFLGDTTTMQHRSADGSPLMTPQEVEKSADDWLKKQGLEYKPTDKQTQAVQKKVSDAVSPILAPVGKAFLKGQELTEKGLGAIQPKPGSQREADWQKSQADFIFGTAINAATAGAGKALPAAGKFAKETARAASAAAIDSAAPTLSKETLELVKHAHDLGINIRPDQLTDNRYIRILGDITQHIPLGGGTTKETQVAVNKELGRLIGADPSATTVSPKVFADAMQKSGKTIEKFWDTNSTPVDGVLRRQISDIAQDFHDVGTADEQRVFNKVLSDIKSKIDPLTHEISGDAAKGIRASIDKQIADTGSNKVRNSLEDMKQHLLDAVGRGIKNPNDLQAFDEARTQYARGKVLEPLVAKNSGTGNITAAQLKSAISRTEENKRHIAMDRGGDLNKLADIGQVLLKEAKSSGTTERSWVGKALEKGGSAMGGAIGAGAATASHVVSLPGAAAAIGGPIAASRIYNKFSPAITKRIVEANERRAARAAAANAPKPPPYPGAPRSGMGGPGMPPPKPPGAPPVTPRGLPNNPSPMVPAAPQIAAPRAATPVVAPRLPPAPVAPQIAAPKAATVESAFKPGFKQTGLEMKDKHGATYNAGVGTFKAGDLPKSVTDGVTANPEEPIMIMQLKQNGESAGSLAAVKNNDGTITVRKVSVQPGFTGKGLTNPMYKQLNKVATIKPDSAQTADGKRIWESFRKRGLLDKDGNLPKGAL